MPFDLYRPFTRADALAAGVSPGILRSSRFRRLFRGVYVAADVEVSTAVRAEAALLLHPAECHVSHTTAAELRGLPVPRTSFLHVSVTDADHRRRHPGVIHHLSRPAPGQTRPSWVGRVRASEGVDLFVELGSLLDLVDLVVVGDAMVRLKMATVDTLRSRAASCHLARAVDLVRPGVESPMESRLRLLVVLAGLPEPVVNPVIHDEIGRARWRLDLAYPQLRLAIEYDGRHHREDLGQWDHDIARREWFDARGWRFIVVVARDIYQRPQQVVERIAAAIVSAGGRCPPLTQEWRAHFGRNN